MNKQRMLDLADYIETQVSELNFDMQAWSSFLIDYHHLDDSKVPECKTTACLAGWAWIKEHQEDIEASFDQAHLEYSNDAKFWERPSQYRYGGLRPSEEWAKKNNIKYDMVASPERIFATEWLELTEDEATELFTCINQYGPESIWDTYREQLYIDVECDCPRPDYCDYDHLVETGNVHRDAGITMLRKLGSGEWSFSVSQFHGSR